MKRYGVIMAGGEGTRFWPLSRRELPKQFLNLTGADVLVNETFDRLTGIINPEDIFLVTNILYAEKALEIMNHRVEKSHILGEPEARNTAACIGYAAMEILKKYGDGVMCIVPSDHYVKDWEDYQKTLDRAASLAEEKNCLVTIGIRPNAPSTGYGYIRTSTSGPDVDYQKVEEFVEKPPLEVAKQYVNAGFCWNSGIFVWKASVILDWFQRLLPDIYECLEAIGQAMGTQEEQTRLFSVYPSIPKNSIDYGIMERADDVFMLEGSFGWNDIGSLNALEVLHKTDKNGNVCIGSHIVMDTKDTICYSKKRIIAAIGVENLMIVETDDVLLVCPKDKSQEVKRIVQELEKQGRKDCL